MANYPQVRPLGLDALVVRFSGEADDRANRATLAFAADLRTAGIAGVEEVASALSSLIVRFDPLAVALEAVEAAVRARLSAADWMASDLPPGRRLWSVPVALGGDAGPEIGAAAQAAGAGKDDLTRLIESCRVRVLAIGFAPGQPYLGYLPEQWNIPRKQGLTSQVPEGALVMAVRQLIVFARPAPTGWWHIGASGFRPYRPGVTDPIALAPGDEMRFRVVPVDELAGAGDGLGGAIAEALS